MYNVSTDLLGYMLRWPLYGPHDDNRGLKTYGTMSKVCKLWNQVMTGNIWIRRRLEVLCEKGTNPHRTWKNLLILKQIPECYQVVQPVLHLPESKQWEALDRYFKSNSLGSMLEKKLFESSFTRAQVLMDCFNIQNIKIDKRRTEVICESLVQKKKNQLFLQLSAVINHRNLKVLLKVAMNEESLQDIWDHLFQKGIDLDGYITYHYTSLPFYKISLYKVNLLGLFIAKGGVKQVKWLVQHRANKTNICAFSGWFKNFTPENLIKSIPDMELQAQLLEALNTPPDYDSHWKGIPQIH